MCSQSVSVDMYIRYTLTLFGELLVVGDVLALPLLFLLSFWTACAVHTQEEKVIYVTGCT